VEGKHQKYLDAGDPEHLLTGTVVYVHNPRPVGCEGPDVTRFKIGGETLDEALKTVIGTFDGFHAEPPAAPERSGWPPTTRPGAAAGRALRLRRSRR
jgi:hypothetical protein